jgi:hypothetical protein
VKRGVLFAFLLVVLGARAGAAEPGESPTATLSAVASRWNAGDLEGYLALWEFESPEDETTERDFARHRMERRAQLTLHIPEPGAVPVSHRRLGAYAELMTTEEPWGRVEQLLFRIERGDERWSVVARQLAGQIDGLAHLSVDPAGLKVAGHVLRLPDFEMEMRTGTLFTSPDALGRTVVVFVGEGRVRFRPYLAREREQLRKYVGRPALDAPLRLAFARLPPSEFDRLVTGPPLQRDPAAAARWPSARRFYEAHRDSAFALDAPVPGSPWWIVPPPGDALVVFDQSDGPLTLSIGGNRPEGISLFDRGQRRQICLYPELGRARDFDEDEGRTTDLRHQDVRLRLDPSTDEIVGEARLRIALLGGPSNLRLRLNEALRVDSVRSDDGRPHLFFRVRNQHTLMVALSLAAPADEITLVIRYRGVLRLPPFEREHTRPVDPEPPPAGLDLFLQTDRMSVYSQPAVWYPQSENDDFATATLSVDLPSGYTAVAGGKRTVTSIEPNRTVTRLTLDRPVKHLVLVVGRLVEGARRVEAGVTLTMFTPSRLRGEAERTLETAGRILRLFAEEFGPCPYEELQLVLMEAVNPGGHSPPGLVLLVQRPLALRAAIDDPANFVDVPGFFLAHELAHQWWGDGVAGRSYHERWISEGVSQYAAARWVLHSRGEGGLRDVMEDMGRWALRKNDAGPIILGHRIGHLEEDSKLFRAVVYDKAAYVLHMLRGIMGETAFRRGLIDFQETYRFGKAGTPDFRESLEKASGLDLEPYFESWIYDTTLPTLSVAHRTTATDSAGAAGFRTTVTVKARDLPGPVPLSISLRLGAADDVRRETLAVEGGQWTYETRTAPRKVQINEDRGLLIRRE